DGSFIYTPENNFYGYDSFQFSANDGQVNGNIGTFFFTVYPPSPAAVDNYYSVPEGSQLVVDTPGVLTNDADFDGNPMESALYSYPQHGWLSFNYYDGSFTYTPYPDFTGTDSFTYAATEFIASPFYQSFYSTPTTVYLNVIA